MSNGSIEEMGPVDYLVVEWPGKQPTGEAIPHLIELVEKGLIHILDLLFIEKDDDGNGCRSKSRSSTPDDEYAVFEGVSTGIIGDDDVSEAATAIEPGTAAAVLVYENTWAAPFASAMRRSGGQLVAPSGSRSRRSSRRSRPPRPPEPTETSPERNRPMPGLIRGVARTAVVAGTATNVSNHVSRRQAEKWARAGAAGAAAVRAAARPCPRGARRRPDRAAQGARRAPRQRRLDRRGVRCPEGQAARLRALISVGPNAAAPSCRVRRHPGG